MRPGKMGDALMSQVGQMPHGLPHSLLVVAQYPRVSSATRWVRPRRTFDTVIAETPAAAACLIEERTGVVQEEKFDGFENNRP